MTATAEGMFPLFATRFLSKDEDVPVLEQHNNGTVLDPATRSVSKPSITAGKGPALRVLDLQVLPRDDGPPTELRTRKEKLAHFEQQCSHVGDRLYVGGEVVAKSRDILRNTSISHIINCVGFLYPPYFEDEFTYQTLYLQDTPKEDILCVLYDVFDFIEAASDNHHRIFIHCSQGVSRSTTLAIAYRMWKEERTYEDIFTEVKQMRGVANPNIGFICQLMQWYKRRHEDSATVTLYRIAPQSPSAPLYLVPKSVSKPQRSSLDSRGAFVLYHQAAPITMNSTNEQTRESMLYIWIGNACPQDFITAAEHFAHQLHVYEGAPSEPILVHQGQESEDFWSTIELSSSLNTMSETPTPTTSKTITSIIATTPPPTCHNSSYDKDFEIYTRSVLHTDKNTMAPTVQGIITDTCPDSARSGRKTPRTEYIDRDAQLSAQLSPNDRLRKQARSEAMERERERTARSSGGTSGGSGNSARVTTANNKNSNKNTSSVIGAGSESARAKTLDFHQVHLPSRLNVGSSHTATTPPPPGGSSNSGGSNSGGGGMKVVVPSLALPRSNSGGEGRPPLPGHTARSTNDLISDEDEDDDVTLSSSSSPCSSDDDDDDISEDGDDDDTTRNNNNNNTDAGGNNRPSVPRLNLGR